MFHVKRTGDEMDAKTPNTAISADLFLPLVEAFLAAQGDGYSPTKLGRAAMKDPDFVFAVRRGRECRRKTITAVVAVINEHDAQFVAGFLRTQSKVKP